MGPQGFGKVPMAVPSSRDNADGMKILLVEDEDAIAETLVAGLRREGFSVERAATGAEALRADEPDLVLLDPRLPDMNGIDVGRSLRSRSKVPIIVVAAHGEETDRAAGLELGADDYVLRPFGARELAARIRAVLERSARPPDALHVDGLEVDERARRVRLDGVEIRLTPKEFDILAALAHDAGAVMSRRRLLEEVWQTTWPGSAKMIDVHVASLRRKLGDPGWVETVRGVGFRLRGSVTSGPGAVRSAF